MNSEKAKHTRKWTNLLDWEVVSSDHQISLVMSEESILTVSGREGWNACINGDYVRTPAVTNGKPVYYNGDSVLFLKFNDACEWMISRSHDGRQQGCAFHRDKDLENPPVKGWCVSTPDGKWLADENVTVTLLSYLKTSRSTASDAAPSTAPSTKSETDENFSEEKDPTEMAGQGGLSCEFGCRGQGGDASASNSINAVAPGASSPEKPSFADEVMCASSGNSVDAATRTEPKKSHAKCAASEKDWNASVSSKKDSTTSGEQDSSRPVRRRVKLDKKRNMKWLRDQLKRVLCKVNYDDMTKFTVAIETVDVEKLEGICDSKMVFIEKLPLSVKVSWIGMYEHFAFCDSHSYSHSTEVQLICHLYPTFN